MGTGPKKNKKKGLVCRLGVGRVMRGDRAQKHAHSTYNIIPLPLTPPFPSSCHTNDCYFLVLLFGVLKFPALSPLQGTNLILLLSSQLLNSYRPSMPASDLNFIPVRPPTLSIIRFSSLMHTVSPVIYVIASQNTNNFP